MSTLENMSPYKKSDLVLIEHKKLNNDKACSHRPSDRYRLTWVGGERCSLAMVLDTKPKISYVIYVAGKGSEVKLDPFWIDNNCLIPYGDDHESGRHHRGYESPTK
jgi:hypothetical protein